MNLFLVNVGITGTRDGMTDSQRDALSLLLSETYFDPDKTCYFHHGDCVGVDAESHDIAESIGFMNIIHPPEKDELRAYKQSTIIHPTKSYFTRNRDIVNSSDVMFALPVTDFETKGGTWYTINYSKKQNKPLIIIYPDGSDERFNFTDQITTYKVDPILKF